MNIHFHNGGRWQLAGTYPDTAAPATMAHINAAKIMTTTYAPETREHIEARADRGVNLKDQGYQFQGALSVDSPNVYFVLPPVVKDGQHVYVVDLAGKAGGEPTCTCKDFAVNGLPCKHIFGVCANKREIDQETARLRTWKAESDALLARLAA